jgi:formylglycine-generating enzyme required for sulfatase activity
MPDYEHSVFISYAWGEPGEEREEIVNEIDEALRERGLKIIRDKRDLGYKGFISQFMERIGQGNCVIVVISEKYLRSENCMFELVEIAENRQFQDRIFPVILADADIYKTSKQLEYIKYWEKQINEIKEGIKGVDPTNLQGIYAKLNLYDRIRDKISNLIAILSDMNALTLEIHRDSDFSALYEGVVQRMQNDPEPTTTPKVEATFEIEDFEPETILISAGKFWIGSEPGENVKPYEMPRENIFLPSYRIGKYSVTNAQYKEYLLQTETRVSPIIWNGERALPEELENYPVTGVTWNEATAYCQWLSKVTGRKYSLPSEAQWEKACRGGNQCQYPWGDQFDPQRCNQGQPSVAPVNAYPAQNEFGCFDMVGNVLQWTRTLWGKTPDKPDDKYSYPYPQKDDERNDPHPRPGIYRVIRGSSMSEGKNWCRCSARRGADPSLTGLRGSRNSFRVVMSI